MATKTHEIKIVPNSGATAELAPYIGHYILKGTKEFADFAKIVADKAGMKQLEVEAIINQVVSEIVALESEAPVRIDLGFGTIFCRITGGFEASDSRFDPDKNAYEIALQLNKDVKNALAGLQPSIVTDETSVKVRMDNVMDKETPRPYQTIYTNQTARVTGINLVLTDEGAKLVLITPSTGAELEIEATGVDRQIVEFTVPSNLAAGNYKLAIYSRGGDAEGPLQMSFRNVTVVAGTPPAPTGPVITKVVTDDLNDNEINQEKHSVIHGSGFGEGGSEGRQLAIELWENGALVERCSTMESIANWSDTEIETQDDAGLWPYGTTKPDGKWTAEDADTRLVMLDSDAEDAEVLVSFPIKVVEV